MAAKNNARNDSVTGELIIKRLSLTTVTVMQCVLKEARSVKSEERTLVVETAVLILLSLHERVNLRLVHLLTYPCHERHWLGISYF